MRLRHSERDLDGVDTAGEQCLGHIGQHLARVRANHGNDAAVEEFLQVFCGTHIIDLLKAMQIAKCKVLIENWRPTA